MALLDLRSRCKMAEILTGVDIGDDSGQLNMHTEECRLLRASCECGQLSMHAIVVDGLGQSHQGSHLSIQDVRSPPNSSTSLDHWLAHLLNWHAGMHSVPLSHSHSLSDLPSISRIIQTDLETHITMRACSKVERLTVESDTTQNLCRHDRLPCKDTGVGEHLQSSNKEI